MIRWLRVVLDPSWIVLWGIAWLGVGLLAALVPLIAIAVSPRAPRFAFRPDPLEAISMVLRPGAGLALVSAIAYAVYRGTMFHPVFRHTYRQWLECSPWRPGKPLPLGPVHLVWQDLVPLGILTLAAVPGDEPGALDVSVAFFFVYLGLCALSIGMTGQWQFAYAVGFGLGLVLRLLPTPVLALVAALAVYVIAWAGLRQSFADFPWPAARALRTYDILKNAHGNSRAEMLGWPFARLAPHASDVFGLVEAERGIGYRHGILLSLLAGWWLYALAAAEPRFGQSFMVTACAIPVLRLGAYCQGHLPPMSFWGRLVTGRWIIPAYDRVALAPLCALAVWGGFLAAAKGGFPPRIAGPLAVTLVLLVTFNMGPRLRDWQLTAPCRIVHGSKGAGQRFVKVG